MPRGLQLLTPPAAEPVSLAEAKLFARIDTSADDALVAGLVVAARHYVEHWLARQLVTATWKLTLDRFPRYSSSAVWQYNSDAIWQQRLPVTQLSGQWYPDRAAIRCPRPPLQQVLAISYVDGNGLPQTLDPSVYNVDTTTEPGRVAPAYGQIWPIVRQQLASVQVTFTAGYGPVTTVAGSVAAGTQTVTPASMAGIYAGSVLTVDTGANQEQVAVTAVTATTFTAAFALAHAGPWPINCVPLAIRQALQMLVAHWYEHREAVSIDGAMGPLPLAVESLLWAHWHGEYE